MWGKLLFSISFMRSFPSYLSLLWLLLLFLPHCCCCLCRPRGHCLAIITRFDVHCRLIRFYWFPLLAARLSLLLLPYPFSSLERQLHFLCNVELQVSLYSAEARKLSLIIIFFIVNLQRENLVIKYTGQLKLLL